MTALEHLDHCKFDSDQPHRNSSPVDVHIFPVPALSQPEPQNAVDARLVLRDQDQWKKPAPEILEEEQELD